MTRSFAHLHVHTEYSMLDGASRVDQVVAAAAADGQPGLGITDHGNMYGVLEFYKACHKRGIKPIIGMEAYQADGSRFEKPAARRVRNEDGDEEGDGGKKLYYHLTLLAENNAGYHNLIKLSSLAYLEGMHYKPRVDWDLLAAHSEGLIATTGCLGGHVLQSLLRGDERDALEKAARLQDIFGQGNLFVELQDHGIPAQQQTNPALIRIARKIGAPLLATNDSHYTHRHDHLAHDALLCVQTKALLSDKNRFRFEGDQHYLKPAHEMRHLFRHWPEACDSTLWIAERADVNIEFGKPELPRFELPEGFGTADEYLAHITFRGAKERWGENLQPGIVDRLNYELKVISDMGFPEYFLIVWDLIRHAKESGIRVGPGRGSAAGSAVAYCLRITELDPIRYDLLFERFLNPGRVQMPDIDMDFDSRYRDEMIRYVTQKYGREHVAQIITFMTIKARASVKDAGRVLGYPPQLGDRITKLMPPLIAGRDTPLWACFEKDDEYSEGYARAAELRKFRDSDPDVAKIVEVALGLEGLRRGDSVHAAAVVITREPLTEYLPVKVDPKEGRIVTQYEMHGVEELGLLKMDFLALRNLDVIEDTVRAVRATKDPGFDIDRVPMDDPVTFGLLQRAETVGVFQLESPRMRDLVRRLSPTKFEDISALVALYRPGPMAANMHNDYADRKNGRKPVQYLHPDAEDILSETYGLPIYQEQVMRIAQRFAGYSLPEADNLRKACGKKDRVLIAKHREQFVKGCAEKGYGAELGTEWFDIIEPFADYAFNKSHSVAYAYVAYQTAYLKANFPAEYMAALLTSVKRDQKKMGKYLAECRAMGVEVVAPDVNLSEVDFTAVDGRVVFGLSAVRGVGEGISEQIVSERRSGGPFTDFYDFCSRIASKDLNKKQLEAFTHAGGFVGLGYTRKGLNLVSGRILDQVAARRKERDAGLVSLFSTGDTREMVPAEEQIVVQPVEYERSELLALEREALGTWVSDHPLRGLEQVLSSRRDHTVELLDERSDGDVVTLAGVITEFVAKPTKSGKFMASFFLEDETGLVEVTAFPAVYESFRETLGDARVVVIRGRLDVDEDEGSVKLMVVHAEPVDTTVAEVACKELVVELPDGFPVSRVPLLRSALVTHPGQSRVRVRAEGKELLLPEQFTVDPSSSLVSCLRLLVGPSAVTVR